MAVYLVMAHGYTLYTLCTWRTVFKWFGARSASFDITNRLISDINCLSNETISNFARVTIAFPFHIKHWHWRNQLSTVRITRTNNIVCVNESMNNGGGPKSWSRPPEYAVELSRKHWPGRTFLTPTLILY